MFYFALAVIRDVSLLLAHPRQGLLSCSALVKCVRHSSCAHVSRSVCLFLSETTVEEEGAEKQEWYWRSDSGADVPSFLNDAVAAVVLSDTHANHSSSLLLDPSPYHTQR